MQISVGKPWKISYNYKFYLMQIFPGHFYQIFYSYIWITLLIIHKTMFPCVSMNINQILDKSSISFIHIVSNISSTETNVDIHV